MEYSVSFDHRHGEQAGESDADAVRETCSACNDPCKGGCSYYNWCIRESLHDGVHQCDKGHVW
jgi:hypothetical protein